MTTEIGTAPTEMAEIAVTEIAEIEPLSASIGAKEVLTSQLLFPRCLLPTGSLDWRSQEREPRGHQ